MSVDTKQGNEMMLEYVQRAIDRRIARGVEKADRWVKIGRTLSDPAYLKALTVAGFNPENLANMNIYVAEKIVKIIGAYLGVTRLDPYSLTIVKNALYVQKTLKNHLTNRQMVQSLTADETCGLPHLRHGSEGTAATQAASTRRALAAVNMINEVEAGIEIITEHPFVAPKHSILPPENFPDKS